MVENKFMEKIRSFSFRILLEIAEKIGIAKYLLNQTLNQAKHQILVLLYHDTKNNLFRNHVKFLSEYFTFASLEELLKIHESRNFPEEPTVVITFDDGLKSFYREVFPVVREMEIPVANYVPIDILSSEYRFYGATRTDMIIKESEKNIRHLGLEDNLSDDYIVKPGLSRENLLEIDADPNVTIGAHTISHRRLDLLDKESSEEEIRKSKERLEKILGHPINHFAYPKGRFLPRDRELVKEAGFKSAAAVSNKWFRLDSDIFSFPRVWSGPKNSSISRLSYMIITAQ